MTKLLNSADGYNINYISKKCSQVTFTLFDWKMPATYWKQLFLFNKHVLYLLLA